MPSKNAHWWSVYRAIFVVLHGREPTRHEYSGKSGDATNAAFRALSLPEYENAGAKMLHLIEE